MFQNPNHGSSDKRNCVTLEVTTPAHQPHLAGSCKTFLRRKNKELKNIYMSFQRKIKAVVCDVKSPDASHFKQKYLRPLGAWVLQSLPDATDTHLFPHLCSEAQVQGSV